MTLCQQPPQKKRRVQQRTLLHYYDIVKKTSDEVPLPAAGDKNWLFARLPTEVLWKNIFSLLTAQELTHFSWACRSSASLVDAYRGPLPHIVREELLPRKISFVNLEECVPADDSDYFDVSRARTLRFLLKTQHHRVVQVEVKLGTTLWTEVVNRAYPSGPHSTWVEVKIYRQVKTASGRYHRIQLFENVVTYNDDDGSKYYYLEGHHKSPEDQFRHEMMKKKKRNCQQMTMDDDEEEADDTLSLAVEGNHRAAVQYFLVCAKRIAASPSYFNLPNLDYLLEQALPPSLQQYLKPCNYSIDPIQKWLGPSPEALWKHREAPCPIIRKHFLRTTGRQRRDQHGQLTKEYEIHDIPWYRDWYPKKVVLSTRNLLQSLPLTLMDQHVAPFLGQAGEDAALRVVCPRLDRWRLWKDACTK
jgi:hypothetical protein